MKDWEAWHAAVHMVAKSQTRLRDEQQRYKWNFRTCNACMQIFQNV